MTAPREEFECVPGSNESTVSVIMQRIVQAESYTPRKPIPCQADELRAVLESREAYRDLARTLQAERNAALERAERAEDDLRCRHQLEGAFGSLSEKDQAIAHANTVELVGSLKAERDAAIERAERAEAAYDVLRGRAETIREREAACCPEDVRFDEHIKALTERAERAERELAGNVAADNDEVFELRTEVAALRERAERAEQGYRAAIHERDFAVNKLLPAAVVERDSLRAEVAALKAERDALRTTLKDVEWGQQPISVSGGSECPWCLNEMSKGHTPDCAIRAALAGEGVK